MRVELPQLVPIGVDQEKFTQYLQHTDPCFGRHFSKSAKECKDCTTPVITDGKLCLLKEVCAAACAGSSKPATIKELAGPDVLARLQAGKTVMQLFVEIMDGGDPNVVGAQARAHLDKRLRYYRNKGMLIPNVPTTQELLVGL